MFLPHLPVATDASPLLGPGGGATLSCAQPHSTLHSNTPLDLVIALKKQTTGL